MAFIYTITSSVSMRIVFFCVLLLGGMLVAASPVFAQTSPAPTTSRTPNSQQVQNEILQDPAVQSTIRRARSLGVPESQIQEMVRSMVAQRQVAMQQERTPSSTVEDSTALRAFDAPAEPTAQDSLALERIRRRAALVDSLSGLEYFGYRLFLGEPLSRDASAMVPVEESYIVGPGDQLRLMVWGGTEMQQDLTVDREGRVFIPRLGPVMVSGQTLSALRGRVRTLLSRIYSGLQAAPATVFMDLTVSRTRPVRVFVMGEVERPGLYTIPNNASVFQALYAVGGPLLTGSLREVRVIRNGEVVATADLYDYLLDGRTPTPLQVLENDFLFIPPRTSTVYVEGAVRRPGIFEVKPSETFTELLHMVAGLRADAYLERATVDRILAPSQRVRPSVARTFERVPLEDLIAGRTRFAVQDGDRFNITSISRDRVNSVAIYGAVYQPGFYALSPALRTVRDLVIAADSLIPDAYPYMAQLFRRRADGKPQEQLRIPLSTIMRGEAGASVFLQENDSLYVYQNAELADSQRVSIAGAIRDPDAYVWYSGMTVADLILQAGGLSLGASLERAELVRAVRNASASQFQRMEFPLVSAPIRAQYSFAPGDLALDLTEAASITLRPNDQVFIRSSPQYRAPRVVYLGGEVQYAGYYALLSEAERLGALIERAGGLNESSYAGGVQMYRQGERVAVDLDRVLRGDVGRDVFLTPGDSIIVPSRPNVVSVLGNVAGTGFYRYEPGKRVTYYLEQAGGARDRTRALYLTQANGATFRVQRKFLLWRVGNPVVSDGAVLVAEAAPQQEARSTDLNQVVTQNLTLLSSFLTILILLRQL